MKEKIDKIYEVIANKELSFGCKVKVNFSDFTSTYIITKPDHGQSKCGQEAWKTLYGVTVAITSYDNLDGYKIDEIIGHPVMIGDVLDWIALRDDIYFNHSINEILHKWEGKRKPIEEQSEECINYIYNLVKDD